MGSQLRFKHFVRKKIRKWRRDEYFWGDEACVCVKGRGRQTVKKRGDSGGEGLREV